MFTFCQGPFLSADILIEVIVPKATYLKSKVDTKVRNGQ